MKLMKWYSRSVLLTRTFHVKVKRLRLERFEEENDNNDEETDETKEMVLAIKMKWRHENKIGLLSFNRTSKKCKDFTSRKKMIKKCISMEWDEEFENSCSFTIVDENDDHIFRPWILSFSILHGKKMESTDKMAVMGKVSVNIAEEASKMEVEVERKLPIKLEVDGVAREATLVVMLSFVEIKFPQDSVAIALNRSNSCVLNDSDKAVEFPPKRSAGTSLATRSGSLSVSPEDQSRLLKKVGLFSWKRRRLSFRPERTKEEPLIERTSSCSNKNKNDVNLTTSGSIKKVNPLGSPSKKENQNEDYITEGWQTKEIVSRDGKTKLKASMFFASFDQRSDKAAGESACSVLAIVNSHWLQSNRYMMPTRSEFDNLIIEGSAEWRKLCENEAYVNDFPNKHFDLETIIHAHIRPISISHGQSFIAFFSPEKFECLKGVSSFDEIWDKISKCSEDHEPKVYVVSYNDHFFVLKVEGNAYYIVDTLGERLFEGCNQAYILRFDESAVMHGKGENKKSSDVDMVDEEGEKGDENEEMECSGKECCKEFIKRFLAAIPVMELEEEEKKKTVPYFSLHHRLQIEFNFSYSLSPVSSTSSPLFSSDTSKSSPD